MFETTSRAGVLRMERPGTRWLSTGWDGGHATANAAHTVSVPEGWHDDDVAGYVRDRLSRASFADSGPVLLTGVDLDDARGARRGPVEVYATVGLSNPAALPMDPDGGRLPDGPDGAGTVNLVVGTTRALDDAALANLVAVAAEAKAATLLAATGFPGTTTDAVVVACDPDGERAAFSGSATAVGAAARACVRDAVRASLDARYDDEGPPASLEEAEHGVVTDARADVFDPRQ